MLEAQSLLQRRGMALFLGAWLLSGAFVALLLVLFGHAAWPNSLLLALPMTLLYAFLAGNSAYYLCRAFPLAGRALSRIVLVFACAALLSGVVWVALIHLWNMAGLALERPWAGITIDHPLTLLLLGLGTLLYGLSGVVQYLLIESGRASAAERRGLQAALLAQSAELRMLRTQIDPHFLFNSLNSISALTSFDPQAARAMTLRLADFFRQGLGLAGQEKIALATELELSRNFLAIEQVRFGDRLRVEEQVDLAALDCLVPPMLIQPLVENAVKHGIGQSLEGGTLRISARLAAPYLYLTIQNDIDPGMAPAGGSGIGLPNVSARLAGLYGEQARCTAQRRAADFLVEIVLPAEHTAGQQENS